MIKQLSFVLVDSAFSSQTVLYQKYVSINALINANIELFSQQVLKPFTRTSQLATKSIVN